MRAVAAALCLSAAINAQQQGTKVGVVSMQGVIAGTKEGQKASKDLEAKILPKQKEFERRQNELAQLEEQANKGGAVLSEEKRTELLREIDQKKKRLERDTSDARDEVTAEQQNVLQSLGQRVMAVIGKYAAEKGYSLILDISNPSTPILYEATAIDITQDIIARFDQPTATPPPSPSAH